MIVTEGTQYFKKLYLVSHEEISSTYNNTQLVMKYASYLIWSVKISKIHQTNKKDTNVENKFKSISNIIKY